jgi:hypothetical protein
VKRSLHVSVLILLIASLAQPVSAAGPFQFYSVAPCRIIDTRQTSGAPALADNATRAIALGNQCGVPTGAKAAVLNVTVVSATAGGFLTLFPYGTTQPNTSTINFDSPSTLANGATIPLGADAGNSISVYSAVLGGGSVHLILDVVGFFQ